MKILFIIKNENFLVPAGPCIISAIAKQAGHATYLVDINQQDALSKIAEINPDIVAYSALTGEAKHYIALNRKIKEKHSRIFTIMGGAHATFFPEAIYETTLDAVCIGEGEGAFRDLLAKISSGGLAKGIPNILTREGGADPGINNLIEELDSLPFPDYGLFYDNTPMGGYPLKSFITSRGCPYQCTYCFNHAWCRIYQGKGKPVRRHSVDYVIENVLRVKKKWSLSCIKFYDDIFCCSADDWLERFAGKYKKEIGLPFYAQTRCDLLNEDMVKLLKNAGCRTISMSIEAGNTENRNRMLKRNMSDEQIINAHRLCEKYGIYTFTNCIIGLPNTDIAQDIESLDISLKCKVNWAEFPIFHPYPRTELGNHVIASGMYNPEYNKMHTSYQYNSPLSCFTEKQKRVLRNFAVLGSVAVVLPWLRNLIVNYLIYFPPNRLFTFVYYIAKQYVLRKKIYVTRTNMRRSFDIFIRSIRQDFFIHTKEKHV